MEVSTAVRMCCTLVCPACMYVYLGTVGQCAAVFSEGEAAVV